MKRDPELNDLAPIKNIGEWAHKQFKTAYIFYRRKGIHAICHCSECGGIYSLRTETTGDPFEDDVVDIEKPKRDERTVCRICKRKATYKTAGKYANEYRDYYACVGQKIDDNRFVFRIFYAAQQIKKDQKAVYICDETKRIFCERKKKPVRYTWNHVYGWILSTVGDTYKYKVHPQTYREIKKTGMYKYVPKAPYRITDHYYDDCYVMDYYIAAARYPDMEMIVKLGMDDLANDLTVRNRINFNPRGREIHNRLRINKDKLKMLVEEKGNSKTLRLLQWEKRAGKHWSPEEFAIVSELYKHEWNGDIYTVLKYANPIKLKNFFNKQGIWYGNERMEYRHYSQLRREYFDYIRMREEAGYDMTNEIILYPKDVLRRHHEMILEQEKKEIDKRIKDVLRRFPKIKTNYQKISDIYSASAAGYIIRPAKDAAEIVTEGRVLHHCVGSSNMYLNKHSKGIAYILFLRKVEKPDTPYITVEIEDDEIVQWYGAYDKKPNEDFFDAWLKTYTAELKKHQESKAKKQQKTA